MRPRNLDFATRKEPKTAVFSLLFMYVVALLAIVLLRHEVLDDPHYWDALGGYVAQSRFMAQHGFDLSVYRELGYVRPPLFTGSLALLIRLCGTSARQLLHFAIFGWGALILPATYLIARTLGSSPRTALLAAALCLFSPHFVGQVGLVQSDLPLTAFTSIAWVLLLRGRFGAFVFMACLSVLIKETAVFLLPPAALLLWLRAGSPLVSLRTVRLWLPLLLPGVVLLGWLLLHRHMIGQLIIKDHVDALSARHMPYALFHNFIDGGRFVLLLTVLIGAGVALRRGGIFYSLPVDKRRGILATWLAFMLMPVYLPTTLPRYMMPTLPLLCALAALALEGMTQRWRAAGAALIFTVLVLGWGGALTVPDNPHREGNTTYRTLLAVHQQLALEVAALKPKLVFGGFPTFYLLTAPPEDGYLDAPLNVHVPTGSESIDALCACDLLVQAQDPSVEPAIEQLKKRGALTLISQFGSNKPPPEKPLDPIWDLAVRIYRIDCSRPALTNP